MVFSRGVADPGVWGSKFFGRIMMQVSHIGDGCSHKVWKAKVIYGLEPVFESGNTCIIKARNPIAYGGKGESCLIDRNLEIVTQVWRILSFIFVIFLPFLPWDCCAINQIGMLILFCSYFHIFCLQECKIQNLAREYCKIFSAEARVIENFGPTLEWVHQNITSSQ